MVRSILPGTDRANRGTPKSHAAICVDARSIRGTGATLPKGLLPKGRARFRQQVHRYYRHHVGHRGVGHSESRAMRLRIVLFWMSRFLSCLRDGARIGRTMNLYCDRPRRGSTVIKRETSTDPGRGVGGLDQ